MIAYADPPRSPAALPPVLFRGAYRGQSIRRDTPEGTETCAGRKRRTTEARDNGRGIPQGSPLSPLLANLSMRRFVLGWEKLGLWQSLGSRIVTYADDLVILCRGGKAQEAWHWMRQLMGKLKLTVNAEKTRICKVPEGEFDFLGFHVRTDVFTENLRIQTCADPGCRLCQLAPQPSSDLPPAHRDGTGGI